MKSRMSIGLAVLVLTATTAAAQQGTSELRGRVLDAQGAVLPGLDVLMFF